MIKFTAEEVSNIISTSPRINGAYNLFFKLNDKVGLKLSTTRRMRDSNYNNQEKAASFGLGPEVYGKINDVEYEGRFYFGYFTEIVEVLDDEFFDMPDSEIDKFYDFIWEDEGKQLVEEIREKVFYWCDYHLGNVGWKNGKIVCVDFDGNSEQFECKPLPY